MPKSIPGKLVVRGLIAAIALAFVLGLLIAWWLGVLIHKLPPPITSPDGTLTAFLSVTDSHGDPDTHMRLAIELRDSHGTVVYKRQTKASALRYYNPAWESDKCFKLESSEVGTLRWFKASDGTWTDAPENAANVVPPATTQPSPAP